MPSRRLAATGPASSGIGWHEVEPAPLVLVSGSEGLLSDRAVERVVAVARAQDPDVEVTRVDGAGYQVGHLTVVTSPSLFDEQRVVVVEDAQAGTEELFTDLAAYAAAPSPDVVLVVQHSGGTRGRAMLDAVKGAGAVVVRCDPVKRDGDKATFATEELRRLGRRRAEPAALRALVEACGGDLRELAAACQQLAADTAGPITVDVVTRYYGGRVEATGFKVADAAVEGRAGDAVALLRHAVDTGTDPVPLVAALAAKLRTLVKVGAARGRGLDAARDLGLAPWQVDRAKRELAGWTPEGLAAAITAVAQADAEVKGAGRDPVFAVERAVLRVAAARR